MNVRKFLKHLESSDWYEGQIVRVEELPERPARFAPLDPPLAPRVASVIGADGIAKLYTHQAEAIARSRRGEHVVVVTGTASGKTLCYNAPVIESVLEDAGACALYLYPTKALAQDQLRTSAARPRRYRSPRHPRRRHPAQRVQAQERRQRPALNPDMLHSGFSQPRTWARWPNSSTSSSTGPHLPGDLRLERGPRSRIEQICEHTEESHVHRRPR
jgi:DEAD/DEAH box helicase domain-containing protein